MRIKYYFLSFAMCAISVAMAEQMPEYKAPFADKESQVLQFTGKRDGSRIEFGSKMLQSGSGLLQIMEGSRSIAEFYPHFGTRHAKTWFSPTNPLFKSSSGGDFEFDAEFPANDQGGIVKYGHKLKLEESGLIDFSCHWNTEDMADIREGGIFFNLPMSEIAGHDIKINDEIFKVEDITKYGVFQKAGNDIELIFYNDIPKHRFSLKLSGWTRLVGQAMQGNRFMVRIYPFKGKTDVRFKLDMTRGIAGKNSVKYSGIDFYETNRQWVPDYNARRNLVPNSSFESGLQYYLPMTAGYGTHPDYPLYWEDEYFKLDSDKSHSGKHCLRVTAPPGIPRPVRINTAAVPFSKGDYTISFYARAQESCRILAYALFNKGNSPWQSGTGAFAPTSEWRRFSFKVSSIQDCAMVLSFQINANGKEKGYVWIDDIQIEAGAKATEYQLESVNCMLVGKNVVNTGEKFNLKLVFSSLKNLNGQSKVSFIDWHDRVVGTQEAAYGDGLEAQLNIPPNLQPGTYRIKIEYADGQMDFQRFAVLNYRQAEEKLKDMFAFGYGGSSLVVSHVERLLERWRQIGIGAEAYGQVPVKLYDMMRKHGIDVPNVGVVKRMWKDGKVWLAIYKSGSSGEMLIQDFRLENVDGKLTDDYRERFKNAVKEIVSKSPWVKVWKFGGEDEAKWPDWASPGASEELYETYVRLNLDFIEAVREVNPNAKFANSAPCNSMPESGIRWVEHFLKALKGRAKYDYMAIHTYQTTPYPLDHQLEMFIDMIDRNGQKGTPVLLPEGMHYGPYEFPQWGIYSAAWGPPRYWYFGTLSYDMGWMEKRAAAWYARSYLVCLKYSDRVKSATSGAGNFFALDVNLTPYLYQNVINGLSMLLGSSSFVKDISFAPQTKCLVFEDNENRPVIAVWNEKPDIDNGREEAPWFKVNSMELQCFDMAGKEFELTKDKNKIKFQVTPFPVYFRGKPGSGVQAVRNFADAGPADGAGFLPLHISAKLKNTKTASVRLRNQISKPYTGELLINDRKQSVELASLQVKDIEVPLDTEVSDRSIQPIQVPLRLASNQDLPKIDLEAFAVRPFNPQNGWNDIPQIPLKNRTIHRKGISSISDEDFSGSFQLAYDRQNLYLKITVKDDKFYRGDKSTWNNDTVQIYFDTFADARGKDVDGYDDNDYAFNVYPNKGGKGARVWRELSPDPQLALANNAPPDNAYEDNIKADFRLFPGGYEYEIVFPGKYILPIHLVAGTTFGFSLFVNDRDDADGVKSSLTLTQPGTGCYRRPHLWPQVILKSE